MAGPLQPQDDVLARQLFAAAAERQAGSLLELANLYRDSLRLLAARELDKRNLGKASISSAIQESMVRIGKNADWFDCRSLIEFEGWLATVLKNVVRDRRRYRFSQRRNPALEVPLAELESREFWQRTRSGNRLASGIHTSSTDELEHRRDVVQRSLEKLPPHYQAVIRSYYEQQESLDQLAERLQSTRNAVRMLIQRAINRLKDEVSKEMRRASP